MDEIAALPAFEPNSPFRADDFADIVGDYSLSTCNDPIECCVLRPNERLCSQNHWKGYVVIDRFGAVTVIGHCCAKKLFPDDDRIKQRIEAYEREAKRQQAIAIHRELASSASTLLEEIRHARTRVLCLQNTMIAFRKRLPDQAVVELKKLARRGSGSIVFQMLRTRTDRTTGETETTEWEAQAGNLRGIQAMDNRSHLSLGAELKAKQLDVERHRVSNAEWTLRQANGAIKALSGVPDLVEQVGHAEQAAKAFLGSPDLSSMIYLVDKTADRVAVYRAVTARPGHPIEEAAVLEALNEMDRAHTASHGADSLRFPVH